MSHLYEHGPLCLHDHLQQRFDQSLRCSWDQVEKVNDGRTDLHLLQKESENRGKKGEDEVCGEVMGLETDIISDKTVLMDSHCGETKMNLSQKSTAIVRYTTPTRKGAEHPAQVSPCIQHAQYQQIKKQSS